MSIEVTNSTFHTIIKPSDFLKTEKLESALKHYYYNAEHDQKGIIVMNFTSSKRITQYYLTDINA